MTQNEQPVSDEAYEKMRERIGEHFDHVRDLLENELDDDA